VTEMRIPDRVISRRAYVLVCGCLLVLTLATILLAQINLRGWNMLVGLGIATMKGILIALFFMHLRVSGGLTRLVGVAALLWLAILIAGTLDDLLTRGWLGIHGK
jgi:cytochrome c oxidase subunit 4